MDTDKHETVNSRAATFKINPDNDRLLEAIKRIERSGAKVDPQVPIARFSSAF